MAFLGRDRGGTRVQDAGDLIEIAADAVQRGGGNSKRPGVKGRGALRSRACLTGHQSADVSASGETGALGSCQQRDVLDLVPTSIDFVHALAVLARTPGGRYPRFVHGHVTREETRQADGPREGTETVRVSVAACGGTGEGCNGRALPSLPS